MKLLYFHPKFTCKLYISLCLKFAQIRLCYIQGYDNFRKETSSVLNLQIVDTVERVENTCNMGALSKQIQYFKVILKRKGGGGGQEKKDINDTLEYYFLHLFFPYNNVRGKIWKMRCNNVVGINKNLHEPVASS